MLLDFPQLAVGSKVVILVFHGRYPLSCLGLSFTTAPFRNFPLFPQLLSKKGFRIPSPLVKAHAYRICSSIDIHHSNAANFARAHSSLVTKKIGEWQKIDFHNIPPIGPNEL